MLSSLKSTPRHIRFFSDKKLFTLDRSYNHQNDRWICKEPSEVPLVLRSKKPAAACMVLGVISSEGDAMPPHFFPPGPENQQKGVPGGPTGGGHDLDESCAQGQEIHLPTRFSTCSQGQGGSVLAAGECAPLLACGCLAPQQPQHVPL